MPVNYFTFIPKKYLPKIENLSSLQNDVLLFQNLCLWLTSFRQTHYHLCTHQDLNCTNTTQLLLKRIRLRHSWIKEKEWNYNCNGEREREREREICFSNVPLSETLTMKCVYQCFLTFSSIYYSIQRFYSPISLKIQWTY